MKLTDAMNGSSRLGIGAMLLSRELRILSLNEAGSALLGGEEKLLGEQLPEALRPLAPAGEEKGGKRVRFGFGIYLRSCPSPWEVELSEGERLIFFRDAGDELMQEMLRHVLNRVHESVVLCDEESRILYLNEAAVQMDSLLSGDVLGERVADVYHMQDGSDFAIPTVLRSGRPLLSHRQHYTTRYGKIVDVVTDTWPLLLEGRAAGAYNVMQDWSEQDNLHRQILDLQEKLLERKKGRRKQAKSGLTAKYEFRDIIYAGGEMKKIISQCMRVAKSDSSVMIYGETGTGKELFAQSIHNASGHAEGPFLAINCAAIPETLLEALLFGTEKGAFTGSESREGLLEQADGGTLLLDEINSMNIALQSKLLRVIQEGAFRRVGGADEISVDVRLLSNINIPPYQAIAENCLRRDLFYRLGAVNINIPPLRKRREDIGILVRHFLSYYNKKLSMNVLDVDADTMAFFYRYSWPGNVRELQHAIEHAVNMMPEKQTLITADCIPEHIILEAESGDAGEAGEETLDESIRNLEYRTICSALVESGGNVAAAARSLNMSRQRLQYRMKKLGISCSP